MVKKVIAYIIAIICLICIFYFVSYHGNLIPHPGLWAIGSVVVGLLAAYMGITAKTTRIIKQEQGVQEKTSYLKQSGKKIIISLDNCEIKENNYYEEAGTNWSQDPAVDSIYNPGENAEQQEVDQSVIVYYYDQGVSEYEMVSHVFNHDAISLSAFIVNKQVALYINPHNVKDYLFELIN